MCAIKDVTALWDEEGKGVGFFVCLFDWVFLVR